MAEEITVDFEITPLGNVNVAWQIPSLILYKRKSFEIELPGFKYDLPTFASIPVPFSSIATELLPEVNNDASNSLDKKIDQGLYSSKNLKINNIVVTDDVILKYSIPNLVNRDGVFFVMVYPFRSPFVDTIHNINIRAKFSYNVRKYKFQERYFSYPENSKLSNQRNFKSTKKGDEITIKGQFMPSQSKTLDLHLTATRFPLLIRRDVFWFSIFCIITLLALSPYILAIVDILKDPK